ncbi:MAG: cell division protein FtsQ [Calditrichaeota bacterium]|nr:cell division protein FtsQ [Calditrichota bacterium]
MDLLKLGRHFLFFGLALTTALLITLQILELHSPGTKSLVPFSLHYKVGNNHLVQSIRQAFAREVVEPVPLSNPVMQQALAHLSGSGRPFAYLSFHKLYVINSSGKILGLADSVAHKDMPLITADEFLVNPDNFKVTGEAFAEGLDIIKSVSKLNPIIRAQLSEVNINKDLGPLLYMDWARGVPVIFGNGSIKRKLAYLDAFYKKWGASNLVNQTKCVDLRVEGKIILKKRV